MSSLILCEWVPKWVFHNFKRTEATYQLLRLKGPSNIVDSYKIMKKSPMRGCFQAKTRTTFYRWCHHQCMTMWKFACSLIHCVGKHYYSFFLLSIDRHWGILIYNKIILGDGILAQRHAQLSIKNIITQSTGWREVWRRIGQVGKHKPG